MNKETMLLNAAKAMGFTHNDVQDMVKDHLDDRYGLTLAIFVPELGNYWNPLESSADCAEMEDAKMVNILWCKEFVTCGIHDGTDYLAMYDAHYKDHANKGAARRYASTMVVAMIGSKM